MEDRFVTATIPEESQIERVLPPAPGFCSQHDVDKRYICAGIPRVTTSFAGPPASVASRLGTNSLLPPVRQSFRFVLTFCQTPICNSAAAHVW